MSRDPRLTSVQATWSHGHESCSTLYRVEMTVAARYVYVLSLVTRVARRSTSRDASNWELSTERAVSRESCSAHYEPRRRL